MEAARISMSILQLVPILPTARFQNVPALSTMIIIVLGAVSGLYVLVVPIALQPRVEDIPPCVAR